jgi:hypothetical protein
MDTTLTIDMGVIVAALAPTIAIVVAAWVARKDAKVTQKQAEDIHALVNDQLTREKSDRLALLKAQLLLVKRSPVTDDDKPLIVSLEEQVERLDREVKGRDAFAATLAAQ